MIEAALIVGRKKELARHDGQCRQGPQRIELLFQINGGRHIFFV